MPPSLLIQTLNEVWQLLGDIPAPKTLAGGMALSYWGYPRSTQDIDIAIIVPRYEVLSKFLVRSGLRAKSDANFRSLGFMSFSQWLFPVPDAHLEIAVDFLVGDSPFFSNALSRAVEWTLEGTNQTIRVLTCEDLILFKAQAGRLIDRADIATLKELNADQLDHAYLSEWSTKLGIAGSF